MTESSFIIIMKKETCLKLTVRCGKRAGFILYITLDARTQLSLLLPYTVTQLPPLNFALLLRYHEYACRLCVIH